MAEGLIDTTLVVDTLRGYAPAHRWMVDHSNTQIGITRSVYLEVIAGCRTKVEQQASIRALVRFELIELTQADFEWATRQLIEYRLSHNVGVIDCLIAAPAARLRLPLYTHNLKHFAPLLGDLAQKPY